MKQVGRIIEMKGVFLFILLLQLISGVQATTYYVSTSGNDGNNGLTTSTPWKTLDYAVKTATAPGSIIALKKGDIWAGGTALSIQHGGNSTNPIVWDGSLWGTGANAILQSTTDRSTPNVAIVNIINCSYVTFQNITIDGNNKDVYGIVVGGAENNHYSPSSSQNNEHHIIVQDCEVLNCGTTSTYDIGILVRPYTSEISNITIQRNRIDGTGSHCISFYPVPTTYGGNGAYIRNCYIGYNTCTNYRKYLGNTGYGIHINNRSTNIIIEHNTITTGVFGGNHCMDIESNDPTLGIFPTGIVVRYNHIYAKGNWGIVSFEGQAITADIYGNYISNIGGSGTRGGIWFPTCTGAHAYVGAHFNIYNNTIIVDGSDGVKDHTELAGTVNFYNNIIYNSGTDGSCIWYRNGSCIHSNNLYYRSGAGDLTYVIGTDYLPKSSVAAWEPTAITKDPFFVNFASGDYHLQTGSPAIAKGIAIAMVSSDLDKIPFSAPPSIGCYELPVSYPDPIYISSQIANATPSKIDLTYDILLDSINPPPLSAFDIKVNLASVAINSISISGSKLSLSIASPVIAGDVVTVSYTKPLTNALKSRNAKEAASLNTKPVTNNVIAIAPTFIAAVVEDATPSLLELTYDKALNATVIPATSDYTVLVNGTRIFVNSILIVGSKVSLTLRSPVVNGDIVKFSYAKSVGNELQGINAATVQNLDAIDVTNKCLSIVYIVNPEYVSSVIEDANPDKLVMNYSISLDSDSIPALDAFTVLVDGISRTINSIVISGQDVILTLSSPVVFGNSITVSYTKPASSLLQTSLGGLASNLASTSVTNNINEIVVIDNPIYQSSLVADLTPSQVELTYDRTLDNSSIPTTSAYTVQVNFSNRQVNSVAITGSKVILTLQSKIVFGDLVTVAYTKPLANQVRTSAGGVAASIGAKNVVNNVKEVIVIVNPIYSYSVIENASPALLEMTFNLSLDNSSIPDTSAFTVQVNQIKVGINTVTVSGTKVRLSLQNPVKYGDVVSVAYSKPLTKPLKTPLGGIAVSMPSQAVNNNLILVIINLPPNLQVQYDSLTFSGFVSTLDASGSFDPNGDVLTFEWTAPANISVSSLTGANIQFLNPVVNSLANLTFSLKVSDGLLTSIKNIVIHVSPYMTELSQAEIVSIEASNFEAPNVPENIADNNPDTRWSSEGINEWAILHLKDPFLINYFLLGFLPGQRRESYFEIQGSNDDLTWDPILTHVSSCNFSGDLQAFILPESATIHGYSSIKLVGQANSENNWNSFSDIKIYGTSQKIESAVILYPNPAYYHFTVELDGYISENAHIVRVINNIGSLVNEFIMEPNVTSKDFSINLPSGVYTVHIIENNIILSSQNLIIIRELN
jgi:uncharacterized repeat protein (TIGR02059 family)